MGRAHQQATPPPTTKPVAGQTARIRRWAGRLGFRGARNRQCDHNGQRAQRTVWVWVGSNAHSTAHAFIDTRVRPCFASARALRSALVSLCRLRFGRSSGRSVCRKSAQAASWAPGGIPLSACQCAAHVPRSGRTWRKNPGRGPRRCRTRSRSPSGTSRTPAGASSSPASRRIHGHPQIKCTLVVPLDLFLGCPCSPGRGTAYRSLTLGFRAAPSIRHA